LSIPARPEAPLSTIEFAVVTDRPPARNPLAQEYWASDRLHTLELPDGGRLQAAARSIELAMQSGAPLPVRQACAEFLEVAAGFYQVARPPLRVLAARPLRVREGGWTTELFGDYNPGTKVIRVWMRTAVQKKVTSFGAFLSTLCHEFCHHLDVERLGFHDTPHTRGFFERAAALYHHARGTPRKPLFWVPMSYDRWRIDWQRTTRGAGA
jgi:hypothetical protein